MTLHTSRLKTRLVLCLTALAFAANVGTPRPLLASPRTDGALNLMPVPESLTLREGRFHIDEGLVIGGPGAASSRAFKAAARFMTRLAGRTGLFLKQDFLAAQNPGRRRRHTLRL